MISTLYQEIGQKLKTRRIQLKITQQDLADIIGLKRTSIANLESGRQCIPLGKLYELCHALDMQILDVLPSSRTPEKTKKVTIDGKEMRVSPQVYNAIKSISDSL